MQRSGACQITIKVLEHDESEPVKRSRSRKVSLVRGALSVRQESSVQHQISKADVIYMKSAEVGAGVMISRCLLLYWEGSVNGRTCLSLWLSRKDSVGPNTF
eukprot:g7525.t1